MSVLYCEVFVRIMEVTHTYQPMSDAVIQCSNATLVMSKVRELAPYLPCRNVKGMGCAGDTYVLVGFI